jgi:hypothetical protein
VKGFLLRLAIHSNYECVEESVDGFQALLFWLMSLTVEGRIVWMERWVDMTLSTTKFQSFLMR